MTRDYIEQIAFMGKNDKILHHKWHSWVRMRRDYTLQKAFIGKNDDRLDRKRLSWVIMTMDYFAKDFHG